MSHEAPGHSHASAVKGKSHTITGPGEFEIGGVFITGVQTNGHTRRMRMSRATPCMFSIMSGVSVAHLGDLRRVPSQTERSRPWGTCMLPWCLLVGVGLNAAKAAEVISLLEPGIVIPMHYHIPGSAFKLAPLSKFLKEMGLGNLSPQPSLKVSVKHPGEMVKLKLSLPAFVNPLWSVHHGCQIINDVGYPTGREQEYFEFVVREWIRGCSAWD